jgi:hypothetical protein
VYSKADMEPAMERETICSRSWCYEHSWFSVRLTGMEVKDGGRSNEISDENLPKFVSSHKPDMNNSTVMNETAGSVSFERRLNGHSPVAG